MSPCRHCWLCLGAAPSSLAFPGYEKLVPNGDFIATLCPGFGHVGCDNFVANNNFGSDLMEAGNEWTQAFCLKDSDGDGRSNGDELGDPCCRWPAGSAELRNASLSNPGDRSSATTYPSCAMEPPQPPIELTAEAGHSRVRLRWSHSGGCTCRRTLAVLSRDGHEYGAVEVAGKEREVVLCAEHLPGLNSLGGDIYVQMEVSNRNASIQVLMQAFVRKHAAVWVDTLPCSAVNLTVPALTLPDDSMGTPGMWHAASIALTFCIFLIGYIAKWPIVMLNSHLHRLLFRPSVFLGWTLANVACLALIAFSAVFLIAARQHSTCYEIANSLGFLAAGLLWLPLAWSHYTLGIHHLLKIPLEQAWCIHGVLGLLVVIFSVAHGVLEIQALSFFFVVSNRVHLCGLIAAVLFVVGSGAGVAHSLMPRHFRYDSFKVAHLLTLPGYLFALIHLAGTSMVTVWINIVFLIVWLLQRVATVRRSQIVELKCVETIDHDYMLLTLRTSGFSCRPGQWIHLSFQGQLVPHPFTVVPCLATAENSRPGASCGDCFCLVVRASQQVVDGDESKRTKGKRDCSGVGRGNFTSTLRRAALDGALRRLRVAGPYGDGLPVSLDALPALVFVVGGVGVTPALALLHAILRSSRPPRIELLWICRSADLVAKCLPYLQDLPPEQLTVCVTRGGEEEGVCRFGAAVALVAGSSRVTVAAWLDATAVRLADGGHICAGLFVCGPSSMVREARQVATGKTSGVEWHFHAERFHFLPQFGGCRKATLPRAAYLCIGGIVTLLTLLRWSDPAWSDGRSDQALVSTTWTQYYHG